MSFNANQDAYKSLRSIVSERTRRLTVWVGAGASASAGLPSWVDLRRTLSESLKRKGDGLSERDRAAIEIAVHGIGFEKNPWVAFQRLREELGQASYLATIREALQSAATVTLPSVYLLLWKLRPAGFLNLNLDRLATRAFHEQFGPRALTEFDSQGVGAHTHVLSNPETFLYNMHGVHENSRGWVFTYDDLTRLTASDAYLNFIRCCLSTTTVMFVGISADDSSVGGHLERLRSLGIETAPHYWLCDRTDRESDMWAEACGIRLIRYVAQAGDHSELTEALNDLLSYVPPEETASAPPVVAHAAGDVGALRPVLELMTLDAETIRHVLNKHARGLLDNPDEQEALASFEAFATEYDEAVHRAWYASCRDGRNVLMGFVLEKPIARGAFGTVFRARAPDGTVVAIKLLHLEARTEKPLLLAFRRGVKSMSILAQNEVEGIVRYRDASEIPAFVVMDWVEGASLKDAVEARRLLDWRDILKFSTELVRILSAAHGVPQRVLHRDLRPANIMLESFWSDSTWRVVVLDFDLSWHRGAYEHSVTHGSTKAGYLAPEQLEQVRGVSTRHAAVDSFGLGMTLYFVLSGVDPLAAEHRHTDWVQRVVELATRRRCVEWRSLPARFARVVLGATRDAQAQRLDLSQVRLELERLQRALLRPGEVESAELIAEEVVARSERMADYEWDSDRLVAQIQRSTGVVARVSGEESHRRIRLEIEWGRTGREDWRRVGRWIQGAAQVVAEKLKRAEWTIDTAEGSRDAMRVVALSSAERVRDALGAVSAAIDEALESLRFE